MVARTLNKLNAVAVKNAKPSISPKTGKPCAARYGDGGGLFLHVGAQGGKSWVYRWKVGGKVNEMGLGGFSDANKDNCRKSLGAAREQAIKCRELVAEGKNPIHERDRDQKKKLIEPTFWECVERYYKDKVEFKRLPDGKTRGLKSEKSRQQFLMTMRVYAKSLHKLKVSEITRDHVLAVLRPIWDTKHETASRTQGRIERLLSYAAAMGWRDGPNPAQWVKGLDNILPAKPKSKDKRNHPALDYDVLPEFMAELRQRDGVAAKMVEFAILTVGRSKQTRLAKFKDIDLEKGLWLVPHEDMKEGIAHTVPLCVRALEIVGDAAKNGSGTGLIFPHEKSGKMLSENAGRALLIRMNYAHVTFHGFRATFKTWATAKTSFARELIEMSMAHKIGDDAEMAYLRETAHDRRRVLMQAWSDYCAGETESKIIQLRPQNGQ